MYCFLFLSPDWLDWLILLCLKLGFVDIWYIWAAFWHAQYVQFWPDTPDTLTLNSYYRILTAIQEHHYRVGLFSFFFVLWVAPFLLKKHCNIMSFQIQIRTSIPESTHCTHHALMFPALFLEHESCYKKTSFTFKVLSSTEECKYLFFPFFFLLAFDITLQSKSFCCFQSFVTSMGFYRTSFFKKYSITPPESNMALPRFYFACSYLSSWWRRNEHSLPIHATQYCYLTLCTVRLTGWVFCVSSMYKACSQHFANIMPNQNENSREHWCWASCHCYWAVIVLTRITIR